LKALLEREEEFIVVEDNHKSSEGRDVNLVVVVSQY